MSLHLSELEKVKKLVHIRMGYNRSATWNIDTLMGKMMELVDVIAQEEDK